MTRRQAELAAWTVGAVGLIGSAAGWVLAPKDFAYAWLAALTVWVGWPLGSMGLLLVHALTGGRWGEAIRPQLLAGMLTLPLLVPALIPLLGAPPTLYPWMQPDAAAHLANRFYLNLPFFFARVAVDLIVWFGLAGLILRALRRDAPQAALARIAPAGLIALALTVTYAAIDATMSLDPTFVSSVYGLVEITEMILLALAVSVFAAAVAMPPDEASKRGLGGLLLALVILWAYLDFVQLLIIWQSDLANDAPWYVVRLAGGWGIAASAVALGHFVLPFFALVSPRVQRSSRGVAAVAAVLVASAVIDGWWLVVPAAGRGLGLIDLLAMLGLLGVAAVFALRAPLTPLMEEAMRRHV